MLVIFLPGYSLKNKEEMQNICTTLRENGYETLQHEWSHWLNQEDRWDTQLEIQRVNVELKNFNAEEIILVAKSLGTFAAIHLIESIQDKLKQIILMGIPIEDLEPEERERYIEILSKITIPITIIQNSDDHHGSFTTIKDYLNLRNINFKEIKAEGHGYNYPEEILRNLKF